MTQEEKAKAYDEALEKVKIWQEHLYDVNDKDYADELNYIFPELKEPGDERIRKFLIDFIKVCGWSEKQFPPREDTIAWLEKQGQVKESPISQHENKTCKENDDSLTSEDERIRKEIIKIFNIERFEGYNIDNREVIAWLEKQGDQKPVEWSEEDERMLDSIIASVTGFDSTTGTIIARFEEHEKKIAWLKSLKDRVQPQPKQEWSKEDEETLKCISCVLTEQSRPNYNGSTFWTKEQLVRWNNWLNARLKFLRPQSQWKPSDTNTTSGTSNWPNYLKG